MTITSLAHAISPDVWQSCQSLDYQLSHWQKNPRIGRLLSSTVLASGKRLRPLMTFLMADLLGVPHPEVAPYSLYIELVHASTLAHDDVIDHADTRRGEPSINVVASNKFAVLAGDYLLAYVLDQIAKTGRNDLVSEMAAIIAELAEGEWLQMENSVKADLSWSDVEAVALKKTGSVLRWTCAAPMLLAHANNPSFLLEARRLGEAIGLAFQLTDDILDFVRKDGAEGADIRNRVVNAVIFEALCLEYQSPILKLNELDDITPKPQHLEQAMSIVRKRIDHLVEEALGILNNLAELASPSNEKRDSALRSLQTMIHYLAKRL